MTFSLQRKLFILLLLPLIFAIIMGSMVLYQASRENSVSSQSVKQVETMMELGKLLDAVQNERAASYLQFIDYSGADLQNARIACDTQWQTIQALLATDVLYKETLSAISAALDTIPDLRTQIDAKTAAEWNIYETYNMAGDIILGQMKELPETTSAETSHYFEALLNFETAKENASRARILVHSIFFADLPLQYLSIQELFNTNANIVVNLKNKTGDLDGEALSALTALEVSTEWYTLQNAIIEIMAKASTGNYNQSDKIFYADTELLKPSIQKIIDEISLNLTALFTSHYQQASRRIVFVGISLAVSTVMVILISGIVLASITRRFKTILASMKSVSSGRADLTQTLSLGAHDEVGLLANYFNEFVQTLRNIIVTIKTEMKALSEGMLSLSSNTEETAGAIHQITENIQNLKQQTAHQSNSAAASSTTVERITSNIADLYRLIENQSENITSSSSSIEEMVANIQSVTANIERSGEYYSQLLGKSDSGKTAIETVVKQVREIDAQSESLQGANALIAGIAAQTNLLAMNAAIEAAHAGDAGLGFAVVADEIRKLAENASAQSKTISKNIKEIRSVINAVVESSGTSAKTFEEILEQIRILSRLEEEIKYSMLEQSSGSAQILDALSRMNDISANVRESAEEMQQASTSVRSEIRNLSRLSTELEQGMAEMALGAAEIRNAAEDTSKLSTQSSNSVQSVFKEIEQFTT